MNETLVYTQTIYLDTVGPSKPTLLTPASGATANPNNVALSWTIATDAGIGTSGYVYQLSKNSNFTTIALSGTTANTGVTVNGLDDQATYYRRVYAYDGLGNTG